MSASRIDRVGWASPGIPKRSAKPSWMGIPAVILEEPVSSIPDSIRPIEPPPPSSKRPATLPPPSARAFQQRMPSMPPPAISTMREVELEAEVSVLRGELARLTAELATARTQALADSEQDLVKLAITVAARVVGREVEADPLLLLGWIREGMKMLAGDDVTVATAPDVAEHLGAEELMSEIPKVKRVVVDGSLRPGAVEVREGNGIIEVAAEARLDAMRDALGVDDGAL